MYSWHRNQAFPWLGFPIRTSPGQRLLTTSPELFASCNVLHRHILSSHPPYTLIEYLIISLLCVILLFDCERSEKKTVQSSSSLMSSRCSTNKNSRQLVLKRDHKIHTIPHSRKGVWFPEPYISSRAQDSHQSP